MSPVLLPVLLTCLLLAVLTAFWLLWPLRGKRLDAGQSSRVLTARVYRERLQELNADHMASRIDVDTYAALKLELDRGLLADSEGAAATTTAPARPVRWLALAVMILLPLLSFGLYLGYFLNPGLARDLENQASLNETLDLVLAGQPPAAGSERHSLQDFMRALQRRVQQEPHNAEAWMTLGVGFMQAQDMGPAKVALARAAELRPDDIQIVMTYAQASIMSQQGAMEPAVRALLGRILRDQPNHQGALLMLGVGSLRAGDRATALSVLTQLQALRAAAPGTEPGDSEADQRIAQLLAEAGSEVVAATGMRVEIEVAITPELARVIPPDATLFVFARALQGPPMPVAAIRRPVGQFPLRVTMTDADSLSPERLLSQQQDLVLQARISSTGGATPASGDWEAVAVPVGKGSQGLVRLRISQVRP